MIISVRSLEQYWRQVNLPKHHKARILEENRDNAAEYVTRIPNTFKVVKNEDEPEYLKLVNWNPAWAITELKKKAVGITESPVHTPGLLSLPFPLKFPPNARGLKAGSLEFDKRAVAVMHKLLSFTIEERLVTDHPTHFQRELVMPQKLMRLLLKHIGSELIEKCPMLLWKKKVQSLICYRGRMEKIETFTDMLEMEDNGLLENDSENESISLQLEQEEALGCLEDGLPIDNVEMEIEGVSNAYKDKHLKAINLIIYKLISNKPQIHPYELP
ncbi:hypothetical protein FEM48_Zijuj10G0060400 [Ziziphus jujuba var. spinosa]|uniref:PORR domain-containing protein n=1 Tax=Ziziphus jujuba var. spinosa TaxID=714518 RepID=A0A978ULQ8_ZIZJJ|nr:hypothetical protein FEM48_Zijuj10G0060400 [Ziziphus jujuba var. spinosa]